MLHGRGLPGLLARTDGEPDLLPSGRFRDAPSFIPADDVQEGKADSGHDDAEEALAQTGIVMEGADGGYRPMNKYSAALRRRAAVCVPKV